MRVFVSFLINLLCHSQLTLSTIDISKQEFEYLARHLTNGECRKLVASLYFLSTDLPEVLTSAVKKIPSDITCYDLLINWNSGKEKWQGWGKTHEIVERRLRQIYKTDLSKWFGVTVFHNLATDLNVSIINAFKETRIDEASFKHKIPVRPKYLGHNRWETLDSILWAGLISIAGATMLTCCHVLYKACGRLTKRKSECEDELQYLLKDHVANKSRK